MNAREFYDSWPTTMREMRSAVPAIGQSFHQFHKPLMTAGVLDEKQKELIAIGISIALRCEPCIYAHVQRATQIGVTREEILETTGVAVMMQGGPGYVYAPKVVEALNALESPSAATA